MINLRADFQGIKLDAIAVTKIDADSQQACSWTGSKRIAETTKVDPNVDPELGLKDRTDPAAITATGGSSQYFLMKRRIDTAIMPNPAAGTTSPMIIRVVVAIDYTLGRRRRRSFAQITDEDVYTNTPQTAMDPAVPAVLRQRRGAAEGGLVMALSGTVNYTDPVTLSTMIEINFNISVAVTGLTTTPNAIKSYVQLTTTVNWPFALIGWDPEIAVLNGSFTNGSVMVVSGMGSDTTNYVAPACLNTSYFDPVTGNNVINNETTLCKQLVYVRYDHPNNGICDITGHFLLKNITVRCGADVDPTDCPFLPGFNNSDSYVSFYVESPNFCQALGLQASINGLVSIERFTAPKWLTDTDKRHSLIFQRAWSYDKPLFLRIDLKGATVSTITIEKLEKSEGESAYAGDYKSATTVTDGVGLLGLYARTEPSTITSTGAPQYFLFTVDLAQVLASNPPSPGSLKTISFRATVQVQYEALARRRRARIQSELEVDPANYSDQSEEALDSLKRQERAVGAGKGVVAITGTVERPVTSLMSEQDFLDTLKDKSVGSMGANPYVLSCWVGVLVVKFGLDLLL